MALATENAPKAIDVKVVALRWDSRPAPQNNSRDHETTIAKSGQGTGLSSCRDIASRVCPMDVVSSRAVASSLFWSSVVGRRVSRKLSLSRMLARDVETLASASEYGREPAPAPAPQNCCRS